MATLDVEFEAVSDVDGKFAHLAQLLGLADADHARGKVEHLWMACTTRGETDLPQWLVERHLGPGGAAALVEAELGLFGRGRGDTNTRRIRIRGAAKRCLWMRRDHEQSVKGGKARASTASRAGGKFTSPRLVEADQPKPAPSPSPSPSPDTDLSRHAHAILPTPVPAPSWGLQGPEEIARSRLIGDLAQATWKRVSDARMERARALKLDGVLPLPTIHPGKQPAAFDELRERIREEGDAAHAVCDHVVKALTEQADIEWLSEKAFLEGSWRTARSAVLGSKRAAKVAARPERLPPAPVIAPENRAGDADLAESFAMLGFTTGGKS